MNNQLSVLKKIPDGFFDVEISNIREVFPSPTLIQLKGEKQTPLFVSILLHGNEYSGLKVIQSILTKYQENLPRSLFIFVGNVAAAEANCRKLKDQTDFNRCWPGTDITTNETTQMMQKIMDIITQTALFAAIDIHNNTGTNPHYACITDVTQDNQHLVTMFNHIGMVFKRPKGVSTMAFDGVCPAATLECGKPGEAFGIQHATELVDALLHMDHFPQKPVAPHDLQLMQSHATLNISDNISFSFDQSTQADLTFESGFELKNFTEITPSDIFAFTRSKNPLVITNQQGEDVTKELVRIENDKIYLNKTLMPAMITLDETIIKQDCLCYLLTEYQA